MAKYLIHVKGLRELQKSLMGLPEAVRGDVLEDVLLESANPFAEEARSRAPVLTGALKESIGVTTEFKTSTNVEVAIGAGANNRPPYGFYQEFGTAHHPAQPFMRPTWDHLRRKGPSMIARLLRAHVTKAASRLARRSAGV